MQKYKRKSLIIAISVILLSLPAGCSKSTAKKAVYDSETEVTVIDSQTVASNGLFELFWDSESKAILLKSKKTGNIWSTVPYDFLNSGVTSGAASVNLTSPLEVTYIDPVTLTVKEIKGSLGAIKNGRVECEKINGGIRTIYYFDKLGFSIPVHYTLCENGLKVDIRVNEIIETDYLIYQIAIAKYMVSTPNSESSYLFVPSGCGALIKAKQRENPAAYSEDVYGEDPVGVTYADTDFYEGIKLPVFGVKDGNKAMLAIINEGAECAAVEASAGDAETGYSSAWATFRLRGFDMTKIADHTGLYKYIRKFSDEHLSAENVSVIYSPVEDEEPNYVGMAEHYRSILESKGFLKTDETDAPMLSFNIFGGAMVRKLLLGLPYYTYESYTSLKQAEDMLIELKNTTGKNAVVNLRGFLGGGLTPDKVGGGFKIEKSAGGKKEFAEFQKICSENGIQYFVDYDLIRFSISGGGYKVLSDTVKTANKARSVQNYINPATNTDNTSVKKYYLLSRTSLLKTQEDLLKSIEKYKIDGVSLSSLGTLAYSDFSNAETFCKMGMAKDAEKIIDAVAKKHRILSEGSNLYAAILSNCITESPIKSSGFDCFEVDVPFYQILFKSYTPIYGRSINASNDPNETFLKSVESGMGIQFSFAENYGPEDNYLPYSALAAGSYSDIKNEIAEYSEKLEDYYSKVAQSRIVAHSADGKLRRTVFENGITVYVNYGNEDVETPLGTAKAGFFVYGKE